MTYQVVSVFLRDGRRFDQALVVDGGITQVRGFENVPFVEADIVRIEVTHDKWKW